MKAVQVRDICKRKLIGKNQEKAHYLKALKINYKFKFKTWARLKLGTNSYTKVRNRCIITGRGKAVNQSFKLSRLEFRRWVQFNKLPGLEKSSW